MHTEIKQTIKQARDRYNGFSASTMTENLTEQFSNYIAHDVTNESIARIKRIAIDKDVSLTKAIQIEVAFQVEERIKREEARFHETARMVIESLQTIAAENERMRFEMNLVFHVGCKNKAIPDDAFAEADCILMENEILHQLLPIAGNIQNIQVKLAKSVYKTGGEQ